MTDPMETAPDPNDDPFVALAHVRARRAMADLAGFEHHPSWDGIEAEALRLLGGRAAAADDAPGSPASDVSDAPPPAAAPVIDDPMLAFARVTALRLAADSSGVAHDPSWDMTEAAIGKQLHRDAARSHPADEGELA